MVEPETDFVNLSSLSFYPLLLGTAICVMNLLDQLFLS